jgi:hypothetical protein
MTRLNAQEIKAILKSKGWTNVDLAARWGHSETWISQLINDPHKRPPAYDDAILGLPHRKLVAVVRQARHGRRTRKKNGFLSFEQTWPIGSIHEATDSRIVEEGTRLVLIDRSGQTTLVFNIEGTGERLELSPEQAAFHFADVPHSW